MADQAHVVSLVEQFARNQSDDDSDALEDVYYDLLDIGESVISSLAEVVADRASPLRVAAIDLLECYHGPLNSSAALPALRDAMGEDDPWLCLCAAGAIWIIAGESPRDIDPDALAVIVESAESDSEQVRRRARNTLQALDELGVEV